MSGTTRLILLILGVVFGTFIVYKLAAFLFFKILGLLLPLAIIAGIGAALYYTVGKRALGGSGRKSLP